MHVMEADCEKGGGCLTGESAPEIHIVDEKKQQETATAPLVDDKVTVKCDSGDDGVVPPPSSSPPADDADGNNDGDESSTQKTPNDNEDKSSVVAPAKDAESPMTNGEISSDKSLLIKVEEPEENDVPSLVTEGTDTLENKSTSSDSDKPVIDNKTSCSLELESKGVNSETDSTSCTLTVSPVVATASLSSPSPPHPQPSTVKNGDSSPSKPTSPVPQPPPVVKTPVETQPDINLVKIEPGVIPVASSSESTSGAGPTAIPLNETDANRKRSVEKEGEGDASSGSESDSGRKRVRVEQQDSAATSYHSTEQQNHMDFEREKLIQDFVSECSSGDIDRAVDKLQKEVTALVELAREKEIEWNTIIRLRKLKEETLERLLRRKRMSAIDSLAADNNSLDNLSLPNFKSAVSSHMMMVPIVSSSPSIMGRTGPPIKTPDYSRLQRPILPKPYSVLMDPTAGAPAREGRNGPVVDVKSIIADYSGPSRSRHPESVPRRGRRVRDVTHRNPPSSLISMANMALGSGSRVRAVAENPYNLSHHDRLPVNDHRARDMTGESSSNGSYKDVLAQFAKLTGQPSSNPGGSHQPVVGVSHKPPPPPYPEVTLHPVGGGSGGPGGGGGGGTVVPRGQSPPPSSLLHGILTKNTPSVSRSASFSPTLARLLTAPDRPVHPVPPPPYRPQQPSPRMSIADILTSSKKARNEITITPVGGNNLPIKPKEEPAMIADEEDAESGDRLVIDEGNEEPLQCQGCKQKPAQFVCAGCGNQWYCSRECQVTAWEGHSEVCSG